jgi:hypothetical protein
LWDGHLARPNILGGQDVINGANTQGVLDLARPNILGGQDAHPTIGDNLFFGKPLINGF